MMVTMQVSRTKAEDNYGKPADTYIWFGARNGHAVSSHSLPYEMTMDEAIAAGRKIAAEKGNEIYRIDLFERDWIAGAGIKRIKF